MNVITYYVEISLYGFTIIYMRVIKYLVNI